MRHTAQEPLVGKQGQERLGKSKVLIVGVGALGSVTAELLCRAGMQNITLCDYDIVEESNLQRQSLYTTGDIGRLKVEAAKEHLIAIDPMCIMSTIAEPFSSNISLEHIDIIIDGTDSLQARLLLNDAAKKQGIPLIIGTASGTSGMAFTVDKSSCWQCIAKGKEASDDCDSGVLNMATHAVASIQASLALNTILGKATKELIIVDIEKFTLERIAVQRNPSCSACSGKYVYLEALFSLHYCQAREKLQVKPSRPKSLDLEKLKARAEIITVYDNALLIKLGEGKVLVHSHGAMEFTKVDEKIAHSFASSLLEVNE